MHSIENKYRWVALIILLCGVFFMSWELGRDSLWQNEIVSFSRATEPTLHGTYTEIANDDSAPLYEIVFLRPWLLLGTQEFWTRIPSVFFSLLAVAVVYRFCTDFASQKVALYATAIYALNPIQLYYAREGRMYALLAFVTITWIYFLYRTIKTEGKSWRPFIWYAVFAAASVYTHYYGGITLISASLFIVAYILKTKNFDYAKRWVLANLGAALLFAPWVPTFLFQLRNDPISSLVDPSFATFGKMFGRVLTGYYYLPGWLDWFVSLSVIGLIVFGLLLIWWQANNVSERSRLYLFLSVIFFTSIAIAFVLSKLITPMFVIRYFSGVIPVLIILLVYALSRLKINLLVHGSLLLFAVGSIVFAQSTVTTIWRKDYKTAFEVIEQHSVADKADSLLFFSPGGNFWLDEFNHYYHLHHPVTFMTNQTVSGTDLDQVLADLNEDGGVWVVQADQAHLVTDLQLASAEYEIAYDQNFFSKFFLHSRTLKISYLEPSG